jgi:hypothetical protein
MSRALRGDAHQISRRSCPAGQLVRDESCSFRRTLDTCASIVLTERWRRAAISLYRYPREISCNTSRDRGDDGLTAAVRQVDVEENHVRVELGDGARRDERVGRADLPEEHGSACQPSARSPEW